MSEDLFNPYQTPLLEEVLSVWNTHYSNAGSPLEYIAKDTSGEGTEERYMHDSSSVCFRLPTDSGAEIEYHQVLITGPDDAGRGRCVEQVIITTKGFDIDESNKSQQFIFDKDGKLFVSDPDERISPDQMYAIEKGGFPRAKEYASPTFSVSKMLYAALKESEYFENITSFIRDNIDNIAEYDCDKIFELTSRHLRYLGSRDVIEEIRGGGDVEECLRRESKIACEPSHKVVRFGDVVQHLEGIPRAGLLTTRDNAEDFLLHAQSDGESLRNYLALVGDTEVVFMGQSRKFFDEHLDDLINSGCNYMCVVSENGSQLVDWKSGLPVDEYSADDFNDLINTIPDILDVALFANETQTVGILQSIPFDEDAIESRTINVMGQEITLVSSSKNAADDYRDAIFTQDIYEFLSKKLGKDYQSVKRAVEMAKSSKTVHRMPQVRGIMKDALIRRARPENVLRYQEQRDFLDRLKTEYSVISDEMEIYNIFRFWQDVREYQCLLFEGKLSHESQKGRQRDWLERVASAYCMNYPLLSELKKDRGFDIFLQISEKRYPQNEDNTKYKHVRKGVGTRINDFGSDALLAELMFLGARPPEEHVRRFLDENKNDMWDFMFCGDRLESLLSVRLDDRKVIDDVRSYITLLESELRSFYASNDNFKAYLFRGTDILQSVMRRAIPEGARTVALDTHWERVYELYEFCTPKEDQGGKFDDQTLVFRGADLVLLDKDSIELLDKLKKTKGMIRKPF